MIIGVAAYRPFFDAHRVPCVVAGFEPSDLLESIAMLVDQVASGHPALENAYSRAVCDAGNPKAMAVMNEVFAVADADWRGLGTIAASGLAIRETYAAFDAVRKFDIRVAAKPEPKGCACGEILTGVKISSPVPAIQNGLQPHGTGGSLHGLQ